MCQIIGKGRNGTVYLALHKELEEYRAIKMVAKSSLCYEAFRKEALLLKELHHPCLPVIYDIEEDEAYSYLVEEYLQGDSLESLVSRQGPLTRCTVLRYAIQICGVVKYLHSAGTEPILHLDLQPKNILVCHETIKLVDFGQADRLTEANQARQRFGTVGFAAPEQYDCTKRLDERTDIYAIGGLLFYLVTASYPDIEVPPAVLGQKMWSREAGRILTACLEPLQEERYGSVSQLEEDLEQLIERPVSSLIVAVYGSEPGTGATHISLALSACLWRMGIPNLYEECHSSFHMRKLQESRRAGMDDFGIFQAFGCAVKPYYGRQARFLQHHYPVVIQDRGVWDDGREESGGSAGDGSTPAVSLLVAGGKWWNCPPKETFLEMGENRILIYNFTDRGIQMRRPEGRWRSRCLRAPLFSNPFRPGHEAEAWIQMLWKEIEEESGGMARGKPCVLRKIRRWLESAACGRKQRKKKEKP
ncbi:MAG: serine/threonine-protein kinase [Lachnospiraceae bacterium]|nr:serine/threonine-protein kinase [Lachnospiraceae bacterium]